MTCIVSIRIDLSVQCNIWQTASLQQTKVFADK